MKIRTRYLGKLLLPPSKLPTAVQCSTSARCSTVHTLWRWNLQKAFLWSQTSHLCIAVLGRALAECAVGIQMCTCSARENISLYHWICMSVTESIFNKLAEKKSCSETVKVATKCHCPWSTQAYSLQSKYQCHKTSDLAGR